MNDAPTTPLKETPLADEHRRIGAKMVPFAGYEMPLQYSGIVAEHLAVRRSAGIFDVSHMGELLVSGPEAEQLLNGLLCNDVTRLKDGRAQYSAITTEQGGVVDDVLVYRFNEHRFLVCVNASNQDRDFRWFVEHNRWDAVVEDMGEAYGQLAIQGPLAIEKLATIDGLENLSAIGPFCFEERSVLGASVIVARTGYTGEDGVELFIPADRTVDVWRAIIAMEGITPCGLGARDSLRLEAAYPLHGHELAENVSALESGLGWIVKVAGRDFIGAELFREEQARGVARLLVGFQITDAGIARQGDLVQSEDGEVIGEVTSGTKTPTLERAIGLARVSAPFSAVGTKVVMVVRGRPIKAEIVKTPFYSRLTRSRPV
jgi:aminomethyltransferase